MAEPVEITSSRSPRYSGWCGNATRGAYRTAEEAHAAHARCAETGGCERCDCHAEVDEERAG